MNLPILIPSYNPNDALIGVVNSLVQAGAEHIIVIDDGSKPEFEPIFEKLSNVKQCHVLRHAVNQGKGRELKTGMNYSYLTL